MAGSSSEQKPSITGRLVLVLGALLFLHAAYSTYEHLALRKSLGLAVDTSDAVSFDVSFHSRPLALETGIIMLTGKRV